MISTIF